MAKKRKTSRTTENGNSIVRVDVQPVRQGCRDLANRPARKSDLKAIAEMARNQDLIASQTAVACAWVANRPNEAGMTYSQELPVNGRMFSRSVRAKVSIKTSE